MAASNNSHDNNSFIFRSFAGDTSPAIPGSAPCQAVAASVRRLIQPGRSFRVSPDQT
ncbi:MAG: hypothetical protein ACK55Z_20280 [bacterium]